MKKVLFGSEELTQYYRTMRAKIFEYKLYRAYQFEEDSRFITLTFFNFYRYKKNVKTGKISAYYFNFKANKWCTAKIIDQHRGICNGAIPQKLIDVGKKFCQQLNLLSRSHH
ncbi:hypothetical protein [Rodentibacter myodis]|uniref:Uncharacterized protein n=1 Tax=Rodentibacter myodis TaxID=1907939 RepID=A0A1V3JTI3_9PAST|nr:hypothetical protein [Rodentibacter myodis]OOF59741.1 hypothetical protein BKL49_02840 [Rodentibacter myodis]